ncbi:hypothetical protein IHP33_12190 [Enterococcus faecalis]|nr:hypothetical protein [Enterococcus faecalis]MBD9846480.1 hypothetical protein [Enterococcus faecalis]HBI2077851.1 hypothetical protein [Enterococcus faecalis]
MSNKQVEINLEKVVEKLLQKIARLEYDNTILQIALEQKNETKKEEADV